MNYDLHRFLDAQEDAYDIALKEIKSGRKKSHWIWYVFPQHIKLGKSSMNAKYGIRTKQEAYAYMQNKVLKERLISICNALYELDEDNSEEIFGVVDSRKVLSCCTLMREVSEETIFQKIIDKYYHGVPCYRTLLFLEEEE